MNNELVKALNRVARAMERSNNEKVQRALTRAKVDEVLKTLDDKATVARVTAALVGITHPEQSLPSPIAREPMNENHKGRDCILGKIICQEGYCSECDIWRKSMEDEKATIVAIANLVAQGLVKQTDTGINITEKGWETARNKWEKFTDEDKILLGAFMKRWKLV